MLSVSGIPRLGPDNVHRLNQRPMKRASSGGSNDLAKISSCSRQAMRSGPWESAFGTRQSALGKTRPHRERPAGRQGASAQWPGKADSRPGADCRMPKASLRAPSSFTVTRKVTSVTTLPLVESDLIGVSRLAFRQAIRRRLLAANSGFGGALRRSFQGGARIQ